MIGPIKLSQTEKDPIYKINTFPEYFPENVFSERKEKHHILHKQIINTNQF